jgi:hypothetical protein
VALVRTDVSRELSAYIIRVTRIGELRTALAVTSTVPSSSILVTLMKEPLSSSETSVLTSAIWRNIPEYAILYSHCRENLKSYMDNLSWHSVELIKIILSSEFAEEFKLLFCTQRSVPLVYNLTTMKRTLLYCHPIQVILRHNKSVAFSLQVNSTD